MLDIAKWSLRLAVLYLIAGIGVGLYMAASGNHSFTPLHAHINLLGWVSLALFGLYYRAHPAAAASRWARAHFGLYVPAHFVQMLSLAAFFSGVTGVEIWMILSSLLVGVAVLLFAVVVWRQSQTARG